MANPAKTAMTGGFRDSPLCADIVAKVENRVTRKISRKLIVGLHRRCVAFQRHYGGPWSFLDETIWSLTSSLVKRISGSEKLRSSPQEDFCNNIRHKQPFAELRTRTLLSGGPHRRRSGARCTARPRLMMLYAIAAEPTLSATSLLLGDLDGLI
jgi:hypothetical protein